MCFRLGLDLARKEIYLVSLTVGRWRVRMTFAVTLLHSPVRSTLHSSPIKIQCALTTNPFSFHRCLPLQHDLVCLEVTLFGT